MEICGTSSHYILAILGQNQEEKVIICTNFQYISSLNDKN